MVVGYPPTPRLGRLSFAWGNDPNGNIQRTKASGQWTSPSPWLSILFEDVFENYQVLKSTFKKNKGNTAFIMNKVGCRFRTMKDNHTLNQLNHQLLTNCQCFFAPPNGATVRPSKKIQVISFGYWEILGSGHRLGDNPPFEAKHDPSIYTLAMLEWIVIRVVTHDQPYHNWKWRSLMFDTWLSSSHQTTNLPTNQPSV